MCIEHVAGHNGTYKGSQLHQLACIQHTFASDFGVAGEVAMRAAAAAEGKAGHADKPPGTPIMANPTRKNTNVLQVTAAPAWAE